MLERRTVMFLVGQIERKLNDIEQQTMGETTRLTVQETKVFVDELRAVVTAIFGDEGNHAVVSSRTTRRRAAAAES